jgi:hypothetical protein
VNVKPAVNLPLLVNVILGGVIRPELHNRACNLTKEELNQGLKTGQSFYEDTCEECNGDNPEYFDMAYDYADIKKLPNNFSPTLTWKDAKTKINKLLNYKEVFIK